ncbi:RagB/SusD family nutrient uptake outer membrane protein [Flavobacterium sp. DGU11]|uniref:RagB/SusD family nutrient uptake outer membrane protein n=1 Tax=Flavobacterium arundinis TaxID=3139143 RepID=A0ABU9HXT4_9FLAO
MKKIIYTMGALALMLNITACSDFLDNNPRGVLSEGEVVTAENVDGFVNAAYAALGNDHYDTPLSLWPYGNVRSDDAYKGGSGTNDIQDFHFFEVSNNIRSDFAELDNLWYLNYVGISRCNKALHALEMLDAAEYPQKEARMGEMKFIRGHFYFMLKILYRNVPYVTEDMPVEEYPQISNTQLTNEELWEKIASDFEAAAAVLPDAQAQVGRASKKAAYAYLAKTRLYQAYTQDENYNVTGISQEHLQQVLDATAQVMGSASLEPDFANNFLPGSYENGPESIFAIQYSKDDGTLYGRLNFSDVLSTPQGLGCCDFHKPSQNLVNAFKTNNGLPLFNTFNDDDLDYNQLSSYSVDPRLYHTVAIPGLPWKYDPDYTYVAAWVRSPSTYGYFASLKENVSPNCGCVVNIDPFYGNSKNRIQIRYADVLLMRAEALIEMGQQNDALALINQVRNRAANSTALISGYANNTNISPYINGQNCNWTQEYARNALRWERRLELAMEGSRFFDLVRWGVTDEVMNAYYAEEKTKRAYYNDAYFDKNKEEYCPIPLAQINFSQGVYHQNPGY